MHKRKCFISQEKLSVPPDTSLFHVLYPWDLMVLKTEAAAWLRTY